jgi:hypothetical protein
VTIEEVLRTVTLIEGLGLALAVAAIVGHALWLGSRDRSLDRGMRIGRELLLTSFERPIDDVVERLGRLGRHTQIRLFAEIAPSLAGAERATLRELATRLGLAAGAERRCRSRWWWRRLYATRVLTLLDAGDEVMPTLIHDPHQLVRTQVAEWAALHPSPSMLLALVGLLDDKKDIARFAVQDTLLRIGRPAVPALVHSLGTMGPLGIASGLAVAARLGDSELLPLALSFADHPVDRVRAAAADALGAIGGDDAVAVLLRMLADPAAEVRQAATRGLGRLEHWASAAALLPLLGDPTWPVRRESALALAAMGAPGSLILRAALRGSDRFAADIAAQVLGTGAERA